MYLFVCLSFIHSFVPKSPKKPAEISKTASVNNQIEINKRKEKTSTFLLHLDLVSWRTQALSHKTKAYGYS